MTVDPARTLAALYIRVDEEGVPVKQISDFPDDADLLVDLRIEFDRMLRTRNELISPT
ncbi:hypothetical protein [Roseibium sp. TrichSKD4]|uniref:hypothetical protein n=1 Tax=Roseibium sp. TrichSKD4 TaxID=744980 RepID=UPI00143BEB91|nr:hypothetical protein [Roseibium sp. TrichSKD4]